MRKEETRDSKTDPIFLAPRVLKYKTAFYPPQYVATIAFGVGTDCSPRVKGFTKQGILTFHSVGFA